MIPVVHLLTNRAGGFASPALPKVSRFVPSRLPEYVERVRTTLGLNNSSPDYLVNAFLRTLQAHPDMWSSIFTGRPDPTDLASHRPGLPYSTQGVLVHDGTVPASVLRPATEWPVAQEIKLLLNSGGAARIQVGAVEWTDVRIRFVGDELVVTWPAELGVTGRLRRSGGWDGVASTTLWHEPVGFPYQPLYQVLQFDEDVHALLALVDSLEAFLGTVNPARGVALVLGAVVRTHPQFETP